MRISDWSSDVCSSDLIYRDPSVTVRVERSRDTRRNSTILMGISPSLDANGKEDGPKKNRRPMGAAGVYITPILSSGRPPSAHADRAVPGACGYSSGTPRPYRLRQSRREDVCTLDTNTTLV